MPKCSLSWYKSKSNRIMKDIRGLKQKDIAIELNESPQTIYYRVHNIYPKIMPDIVRILYLAGYEIREREEEV